MSKLLPGLSGKGKLKLAIVAALATTTHAVFAGGINPANSNTTVTQQNGVDVVNIAKPNGKGLSHNKFNKYNVSREGAILNNATSKTHSQILNKSLKANTNLNGQAASVILNEVVSKNPSTILGLQEVLGNSAKLIIANPNGISCDGCGFINTPNATLAVGKPTISDGEIKSFNVNNQNSSLHVTGNVSAADTVLNLVAPKVTVNGQVKAGKELNIIAGLNQVDYDQQSGAIKSIKPLTQAVSSFDAQLLGAMQAGRIRIVNTAQGAGVNLSGTHIQADESISIASAGNINIEAKKTNNNQSIQRAKLQSGEKIDLIAKDNINLKAATVESKNIKIAADKQVNLNSLSTIETNTKRDYQLHEDFAGTDIGETTTTNTQTIKRSHTTQLAAIGDININAGSKATLDGSNLTAGNSINLTAENDIKLNSVENTIETNIDFYEWNRLYEKNTSDNTKTVSKQGVIINAGKNIAFNSEGNLEANGARLNAENSIKSQTKGSIILTDSLNSHSNSYSLRTKNEGWSLTSRKQDRNQVSRDLNRTSLVAGNNIDLNVNDSVKLSAAHVVSDGSINILAGNNLTAEGAEISAKNNFHANTQGGVELIGRVITSSNKNKSSNSDGFTSQTSNNQNTKQTVSRTTVSAGENLAIQSDKSITLAATELSAEGNIILDANDDVNITTRQYSQTSSQNSYSGDTVGGAFWGSSGSSNRDDMLNERSTVQAGGELFINAEDNIRIQGSTVSGEKGAYALTEKESITIDNATNVSEADLSEYKNRFIGIATSNKDSDTRKTEAVGSEVLSDTNIQLSSAKDSQIVGSLVKAAKDLNIKAIGDIIIEAAFNTDSSNTNTDSTTFFAEGNVNDDAGEASGTIGIKVTNTVEENDKSTVVKGGLAAGNNINIETKETFKTNGADLTATNNIAVTAKEIDNQATYNTETNSQETTETTAGVTYYAGVERVGNDFNVNYNNEKSTQSASNAVVNTFNAGGNIQLNAENNIVDQASNINAGGSIELSAKNIEQTAVQNTNTVTTTSETGFGSIGFTINPSLKTVYDDQVKDIRNGVLPTSIETQHIDPDFGFNLAGGYDQSNSQTTNKAAVSGTLSGKQVILTGKNLILEGSNLKTTSGDIVINADQYNHIAAYNSAISSSFAEGGSGSTRLATQTTKDLRVTAKGEYHWNNGSSEDITAVMGSINAKGGNVLFNVGEGYLEGVDISAGSDVLGVSENNFTFATAKNTSTSSDRTFKAGGELSFKIGKNKKGDVWTDQLSDNLFGKAKNKATNLFSSKSNKPSKFGQLKDKVTSSSVYKKGTEVASKTKQNIDDTRVKSTKGFGIAGNYEDKIATKSSTTHKVGTITAGGDIRFTAKNGDITLEATQVNVEGKTDFIAEKGSTELLAVYDSESSNVSHHKVAAELGIKADNDEANIRGKENTNATDKSDSDQKDKNELASKDQSEDDKTQSKDTNKKDKSKSLKNGAFNKLKRAKSFANIGADIQWNDTESDSQTAIVSNISSKQGINIVSGEDKTVIQGANIAAGSDAKVTLTGKDGVDFQAITNTSFINENINNAGLGIEQKKDVVSINSDHKALDNFIVKRKTKPFTKHKLTNERTSGLNLEFSRADYTTTEQQAGSMSGGAIEVTTNNGDITFIGTDINANSLKVRAKNFTHEATTSTVKGNGWNAKLAVNPLEATLIDDRISSLDKAEKAKAEGRNYKNGIGGGYDKRDVVTRKGGHVQVNNIDLQIDNNARFVGTHLSANQGQVSAENIQLDASTSTHQQFKVQADFALGLESKTGVEYKDIDRVNHQGSQLQISEGKVTVNNDLVLTNATVTGNTDIKVGGDLTATSLKSKDISTEVDTSVEVKRPAGTITFADAAEKNLPILNIIRQVKDLLTYQFDAKADIKTSNSHAVEQAAGIKAKQLTVGGDATLTGTTVAADSVDVDGSIQTTNVSGSVNKTEATGNISLGLQPIVDRVKQASTDISTGKTVGDALKAATEVQSPVTYATEKHQQTVMSELVSKK
ncbi:hemagglutinin repeat-containing protein [Endozoicomonas sp. SM1973]|uniref:Hemagglutinin repeat-containing protein n=1 Tax=Spartinivicinus marinus TaxID=2994442 RepID=A0A853HRY0_9GAMM|nr:hemagglutinin repeat-containing protein [Spartinivicinus marinus]MCX4026726.1 hemagglutinin repeat-containing protein [Spartinivicinus marinus]NYZ64560.1 hemagglutinin repeat-containing protein [Spartinivicinus marinus]